MSPSRETKEHLEGIKERRHEGQPVRLHFSLLVVFIADNMSLQYQGTARQGEGRRAGQEKPTNPYASLKAVKRNQTPTTAVGASMLHPRQAMVADLHPKPPRKAAAKRAGRDVESRGGRSKHETVAKKTTVAKDAATPSKKRKATEESEEVSDAASDVPKGATSDIYKKRKVVAEAKAEAVVDTKPVEREARVSSGKKRKAADDDAVQPALYGDDGPSAKKRRTEDEPVAETEAPEEEVTESSKNLKTEEVFISLRRPSWSGSHLTIGSVSFEASRPSGEFVYSEGPNERGPQL